MFKDEKYIEKQFGKANHFNVPNGYFEGFTSKMMDKLSADEKLATRIPIVSIESNPSFWKRYRRIVGGVAAGLCIAVFSVGAYFHKANGDVDRQQPKQIQVASHQQHGDTSIDAFVDYTMMDTDDMYAYMADAI